MGEGILSSLQADRLEVAGEEYWTEDARGPTAPLLEACRKQVIWLECLEDKMLGRTVPGLG